MYLGEITDSKSKVKDMHEPIYTRNQDNCAGLLLWVTSLHLPQVHRWKLKSQCGKICRKGFGK